MLTQTSFDVNSQLFDWGDFFYRSRTKSRGDWFRVDKKYPCPTCNKSHGCMVSKDGKVSICLRTSSEKPVKSKAMRGAQGGWIHFLTEAQFTERPVQKEQTTHQHLASPSVRNEFYAQLLKDNPLSSDDEAYLLSCGVTRLDEYGTLYKKLSDYKGTRRLPDDTELGIPGVFASKSGLKRYLNVNKTGIMMAVKDAAGLIVGIEIRLDIESRMKSDGERYQPLSSSYKADDSWGVSADTKQYNVVRGDDDSIIYITEGRKKGEVIANRLRSTALCVHGVSNWQRIVRDIPELFANTKTFVVAYDMDRDDNSHVKDAFESLLDALKRLQVYDIKVAKWNPEHKGIDDALLAGELIDLETYSKSTELYSSEQAYKMMRQDMKKVLLNPDGRIHAYVVTVGGGKTQAAIDEINEMQRSGGWFKKEDGKDARVLWLTDDNYRLLEEAELKFHEPPSRVEGRTPKESDFQCDNYEPVKLAMASHSNVFESVCKTCPFLQTCNYMKNTRRIIEKDKFVIGVKSSFFNDSSRLEKFDIIIVDESMTNTIFKTKTISLDDLRVQWKLLQHCENVTGASGISAAYESVQYYKRIVRSLADELKQDTLSDDQMYRELDVSAYVSEEMPLQWHTHPSFIKESGIEFPKIFLDDLPKSKVYIFGGEIHLHIPQTSIIEKLKGKTVLNLDATPSKIKLKAFGDVIYHEYRLKEYYNLYQVTNVQGTKRQLEQTNTNEFLGAIKAISSMGERQSTLVLSTKKFIGLMNSDEDIQVLDVDGGWYGNHTRGLNSWENIDNIILAGNFCRNLSFMQMQQKTLEFMGIEADLHNLIEEDTLNEMIQAAGRGRAARRAHKPLNLFVLTKRKLPEYYHVKEYFTLQQLAGIAETDQQSANRERHEEAVQKVTDYVYSNLPAGKFIGELSASEVAKGSGVHRVTAGPIIRKLYDVQLVNMMSVFTEESAELVNKLVKKLRPPTPSEMRTLGIFLTDGEAPIYNTSNRGALTDVNLTEAEWMFLYLNPSVGVNHTKWRRFLDAVYQGNIKEQITLAEMIGVSRVAVGKYTDKLLEALELYRTNNPQPDVVMEHVDEWVPGEHKWILTKWFESVDLQDEEQSAIMMSITGEDLETTQVLINSIIYSFFKVDDAELVRKGYVMAVELYSKWLNIMWDSEIGD